MKNLLLGLGLVIGLSACGGDGPTNHTRGVYLLMDTSGTYTEQLTKAKQLVNAILVKLEPGDSFAVARIDTGSFSEKDIVQKTTLDDRPSAANQQKRQFREAVEAFVSGVKPARHTDITGGVLAGR